MNRATQTVGGYGLHGQFLRQHGQQRSDDDADPTTIISGAYAGLYGLKTPYQIDVTAKTSTGGEVHLIRSIEAVSIPVFQFGIYSDVDLAFNAADDFSFGGRVHTNGNLFLSQGSGSTLTLADKVTAVKEVIRQRLSNGNTIDSNSDTGTVNMAKGGDHLHGPGPHLGQRDRRRRQRVERAHLDVEVHGHLQGYIKNGRTGAKILNLPLIAVGGTNTDVVRRPLVGEDTTGILFNERLFTKASIRVMLSDTIADIMNLPCIDATAQPKSLEAGNTYGGVPIAASPGPLAAAPQVNGSVSSGTGKTITFRSPYATAIPAMFNVKLPLTVTSGTNAWSITLCSTMTTTTITGCTVLVTAGSGNIPTNATVTETVAGVAFTTKTTATTATGTGKTLTVTSTMGFTPNTFWVNDQQVSCGGYTLTSLTNCTVAANIADASVVQNFALTPIGVSQIGGYIKAERQNASDGTWHDITPELLSYGIGAPSQTGTCSTTDPSPKAILRLQRLADDAATALTPTTTTCIPTALHPAAVATDYWANSLFDQREGWQRDTAPSGTNIKLGGVMYYIQIDAGNLAKWFSHTTPYNTVNDTGNLSKTDNTGYSIYISDRRNNRDENSTETAEYGWEDFVNPLSGATSAAPSGALEAGEDVNGNGTLQTYGGVPNCNGKYNVLTFGVITCITAGTPPYTTGIRPTDDIVTAAEPFNGVGRAMVNRPIIFRRAIKLVNGGSLVTWVGGFTVVTENPVYIQGDWNASGGFTGAHAATSVIADAVTALSSNWLDTLSYASPYSASGRSDRTPDWYYRLAILAGKGPIFPWISGTSATFGTDGGAHSFIRFLEDNGSSPDTIHYKGSLATFYYNRQAVGVFKGSNHFVYGIPAVRDYTFDTDFQTPSLLPPLTPMFRDINAVGFSQELRPNK